MPRTNELIMARIRCTRVVTLVVIALAVSVPAFAQIDLTGTWTFPMFEDYLERGPGSDLGDFTGMPLTDEGRALALMYSPSLQMMYERQCLAWSPWIMQYRGRNLQIWAELDEAANVVAWKIGGDFLRGTNVIWMDGRPRPSENAIHPAGGFTTGKWEGDTLTARVTHVKTAWVRRGTGIPASDESTFTIHLSRHDDLLTMVTIQEDPYYLTEPHAVSRVGQLNPRGNTGLNDMCETENQIPRLEDTGIVPYYRPGQNPEADHMTRDYNIPKEAAMGYAETLYPEYRRKIRNSYRPPASCDRYCCGWIEVQGLPGGAPNLTCNDGGFGALGPRGQPRAPGQ